MNQVISSAAVVAVAAAVGVAVVLKKVKGKKEWEKW